MNVNYQDIIKKYNLFQVSVNKEKVKKAVMFAIKYHGTQRRDSGDLYYHHPLKVAEIIAEMHLDTDSIVTAVLHDTIEDTDLTLRDIEKHFGKNIAKLVDGVTKLTKIRFKEDNIRQAENFRKLLVAMSNDIRVLLVKLADRLHNMRTINFIAKQEKRKRIALETIEIYAPLAERIGIQRIKEELQDICFQVLKPNIRQSIVESFKSIEAVQDKVIPQIINEIKEKISIENLKCEVSGRRKTPYSTWMKMQQKNINIDQLSDLIAFRVVVNTQEDCYRALGIIHSEYKMIPNSFQDFISTPKNNGYQSLHTVIIGPLRQKTEIQIRTYSMHDVADLGVAAHWRYKQSCNDLSDSKQYIWIRELLSILDQSDPDLFLQNTKLAMYYDQVFCFTPKGSLIALPRGATTVDFAYMVHSDIGNRCVGAKINGKIVPLNTKLLNGDQVVIITSENQTASPLWEKFVVTGKAKGEIQKIIHKQSKAQYIKFGKAIIQKSFKKNKVENESQTLITACKIFKKSLDELFFAIGTGNITGEEIIEEANPKKSKLDSTLSLLSFSKGDPFCSQKINSIPVKGSISGMVIHYAKCCHPLPGDKIVGIIHTGCDINIHTFDCGMLNNFSGMHEILLNLTWDSNRSNIPFVTRIKLLLVNKLGSLSILTEEITACGGNIVNFKITNRNRDYFEMLFDIEVQSSCNINKIVNALRTKEVVQYVHRTKNDK